MLSFARWLLARGGRTWSFDCICKFHVVAGGVGEGIFYYSKEATKDVYSREATNHTKLQA